MRDITSHRHWTLEHAWVGARLGDGLLWNTYRLPSGLWPAPSSSSLVPPSNVASTDSPVAVRRDAGEPGSLYTSS